MLNKRDITGSVIHKRIDEVLEKDVQAHPFFEMTPT